MRNKDVLPARSKQGISLGALGVSVAVHAILALIGLYYGVSQYLEDPKPDTSVFVAPGGGGGKTSKSTSEVKMTQRLNPQSNSKPKVIFAKGIANPHVTLEANETSRFHGILNSQTLDISRFGRTTEGGSGNGTGGGHGNGKGHGTGDGVGDGAGKTFVGEFKPTKAPRPAVKGKTAALGSVNLELSRPTFITEPDGGSYIGFFRSYYKEHLKTKYRNEANIETDHGYNRHVDAIKTFLRKAHLPKENHTYASITFHDQPTPEYSTIPLEKLLARTKPHSTLVYIEEFFFIYNCKYPVTSASPTSDKITDEHITRLTALAKEKDIRITFLTTLNPVPDPLRKLAENSGGESGDMGITPFPIWVKILSSYDHTTRSFKE